MNCRDAMTMLQAVLDGEIGPSEMPEFWEHLANCRRCSEELVEMKRIDILISGLPDLSPRTDLSFKILAELGYSRVSLHVRTLLAAACSVVAAWVTGLVLVGGVVFSVLPRVPFSFEGINSASRHLVSSIGMLIGPIQSILAPLVRALFGWLGSNMFVPILLTLVIMTLLSKLVYDWTLSRTNGYAVLTCADELRDSKRWKGGLKR